MPYWLLKSEPEVYPWEKLVKDKRGGWDGVRNHQAANKKIGDEALFYHSNEGLAVVGIIRIVKTAYPDPSDPAGKFVMVDVAPVRDLKRPITLQEIKSDPILRGMAVVKQSRLSVSPVTAEEWKQIMTLEKSGA